MLSDMFVFTNMSKRGTFLSYLNPVKSREILVTKYKYSDFVCVVISNQNYRGLSGLELLLTRVRFNCLSSCMHISGENGLHFNGVVVVLIIHVSKV